jgi:citronellyl-CoA synthetase
MKHPDHTTLSFLDILPKVVPLLPRIPSILKNLKQGLSIKENDPISIGTVIESNAERYKNDLALLYEDHAFTHDTFNQRINQYANYFLSIGVKDGQVVIIFMENRMEILFLIAALAKIGGVASLISPNQRAGVLKHSVETDPGSVLIIGEELIDAFEEVKSTLNLTNNTRFYWLKDSGDTDCPKGYVDLNNSIKNGSTDNPTITSTITAGQRYANVFTSGTTGLPKASIQRHKRWLTAYYWFGKINMNYNSSDVLYVPIPFFHTNALMVAWSSAAAAGCAIAMRRKFSTSNFWKDVKKFGVTSFIYIGELCRYLYNAPPSDLERQHKIKKIMGNGMRPEIWKEFKQRFNIAEVCEFYGAADGNVAFTNTLNIDCCVGWSPSKYAIVKYDVELQQPYRNSKGFFERVKKGEWGLLISEINERVVFDGYVNKVKNQERLLSNAFKPDDQWFNTGDLLRDIGYRHAQFMDRIGDTFRWKGENVSTEEVEKVVNGLATVKSCAVYGVKVPNNDGRCGMMTLTVNEATFDLDELTKSLLEELPSYAVPVFIRIKTELETTATHKIKKFALQKEGIACTDPVLVRLPKSTTYIRLDEQIKSSIEGGAYVF